MRALAGAAARITSHFGNRADPIEGNHRAHGGLDIAAPAGTPVRPIAGGVVRFAGSMGDYGNCVVIDHPDGTESRYAHCAELRVQAGDVVAPEQAIGTVGATGRATGPHVHLEVRRDGRAVDPVQFFRARP